MKHMKIAMAAYGFVNGDVDYNMKQMEKAIQSCSGQKVDLICFGESFLQGFDSLNWDYSHDRAVAITQHSPEMERLGDMNRRYGVDILFGYLEREGDFLYSSCALIEKGVLSHNYRRISKGWKDYYKTDEHYREGETVDSFSYGGYQVTIALCGDMWGSPERFITDDLLIWPIYVNFPENDWAEDYAQQAAKAAPRCLLVNSLSKNPDAHGGAFYFEKGSIVAAQPFDKEGCLIVEL